MRYNEMTPSVLPEKTHQAVVYHDLGQGAYDQTLVTPKKTCLKLTPYAQVTDLAVNTAASGNNAAAIQSLDDRVTAELALKLDSHSSSPHRRAGG